jgi:hypothetical protein
MVRMPFMPQGMAAVFLIVSTLIIAPRANAQATAVAAVSGTVTDATAAVVAQADVIMTQVDTGQHHATQTDSEGRYVLPSLPVGPYRMEVRRTGFRDYVQTGIVLVVNNNVTINVPLQVGAMADKIEVNADTSMVETVETSVASVIDTQRINDLPLNGRQPTQLILTLGAAQYADSGDTGSKTPWSSTRISVAGGQGNGTAYLLDGGDNTDAMSNVNMPIPFPDALQEFSVETSAVSSRFGTHPGATVNVVTKSGANAFHGDLFEYIRNGDLNARNFFQLTRDTLKRNQFGGVLGGRIIKDKLFFFGGYQGTRNRSNPPSSTTHIPTASMVTGDFSGIASAGCNNGKGISLKDPRDASGNTVFPGNQVPTSLLNPVALTIANKYLPVSSVSDACGTVTYAIPITGDEDQYIGRIDFVQNSRHTIYGRYFLLNFQNPPTYDGSNLLTTTQAGNLERTQSATIGDTFSITPTTLNSFHASFNRVRDNRGPTNIPINPTLLGVNMYSAVPNFLLLSITGGFSTFCGTCAPGHFNVNSFQVADDVDLIRGPNQIALGFNLIRVQTNTVSGFDENGSITFNGNVTGVGLADFMLGKPSDFTQTNATPDDLRTWLMSFYVQDSYKMSQHVTWNFGLRWEPTFSDPDKYGRGTSFSLPAFLAGQVSTVYPNAPAGLFFKGDKGIPAAMWNGKKANFAPRVGWVWNPHGDGRDTFRVGAGILYDSAETWFNERETTNAPYGTALDTPFPVGGFSNPWQGYPGGNPFPTNGRAYFPSAGGVYVNMPVNPKPTSVIQWNATYQRQLARDWVASVSYLGNKTNHLWIAQEVNPAIFLGLGPCTIAGVAYNPCSSTSSANTLARRRLSLANPALGPAYASIDTMDDGATAHYDGMLASISHRFASNFTLNANYTYAMCISDYDFGAALAGSTNSQLFNRHADWGPCASDTRHIFNATLVATSSWKFSNRLVSALVNNWQLSPLIHATSGQPLNITVGKDNSLTGLNNDRPVQVLPDAYANSSTPCPAKPFCAPWVNPSSFVPNALGTYGDVARNGLRGPGILNLDVSLSRIFKIREHFDLQARADFFNSLNHTNFVGAISPAGTVTGYSTLSNNESSSTFGQVQSAFDPRIIQFSLKLNF